MPSKLCELTTCISRFARQWHHNHSLPVSGMPTKVCQSMAYKPASTSQWHAIHNLPVNRMPALKDAWSNSLIFIRLQTSIAPCILSMPSVIILTFHQVALILQLGFSGYLEQFTHFHMVMPGAIHSFLYCFSFSDQFLRMPALIHESTVVLNWSRSFDSQFF